MLQHLYNLNNICIKSYAYFFLAELCKRMTSTNTMKQGNTFTGFGRVHRTIFEAVGFPFYQQWVRCPVACTVRFRRDWVVLTEWWSGVKRLAQFPSVDAYTSPWSGNINIGSGNKVHTAVHLQPTTKLWWVEKEELFDQSTAPLQGVSCAEHTPPATPLAD